MSNQAIKLSVVIPAYNEEQTIKETVLAINNIKQVAYERGFDLSIIVVNDGSSDSTSDRLAEAEPDYIVDHKVNRGLGAAVRTGLLKAKEIGADICVKFDADLQHDPMNILDVAMPIKNDESDIVYGHRFNQITYKMPFIRRIGNKVFSRLMKWLTGWPLKDSQPGIFAVDRCYLEHMYIPGNYNYTQQILLDAYHKGMRFSHVDVSFEKRNTGKSFISLKYPFKVLPQILMVLIGVKPLSVFTPVALFFLVLASGISISDIFEWLFFNGLKPIEHVNAVLAFLTIGLQTLFFGFLAHLVVEINKSNR